MASELNQKLLTVLDKIQEPVVRRLVKEYRLSFAKSFGSCDPDRFTKVVLSLALPMSMLVRPHWEKKDYRTVQKYCDSFLEGLEFLATLDASVDQDLDFIKFESAHLMQLAVGDVDEVTGHGHLPSPSFLMLLRRKRVFGGIIWRDIQRKVARARDGHVPSLRFFASYLLSKRGWPELCDQKKFETIKDHQSYLSQTPTPVSDALLLQVRRTARAVFRNVELSKFSPSLNASYASSRKNGGAFGEVTAGFPAPDLNDEDNLNDLKMMSSSVATWKKKLFWRIAPKSFFIEKDGVDTIPDDSEIRKVRVQSISEPGKARVVTMGDGHLYSFLQPLQGSLLKNWAQSRYSTMKPGWEEEVLGWYIPEGWVWNSGDYKAATDQLNSISTSEAWMEIKRIYGLPDFYSGLEGAEVEYSAKDLKRYPFGEERLPRSIWQSNGQLMGHPLSFPILCIINLAGLVAALNEGIKVGILSPYLKQFILNYTKINGDDILFPCPPSFCKIWERSASELGLKLSVGKSYASRHFAMVNNVMYKMHDIVGMRAGIKNKRLGYLNQKLILNYSLKAGEATMSPLEIGHAISDMIEFCPESVDFQLDIRRNRNDFPFVLGGKKKDGKDTRILPNLYIDCKLGGLGVDPRHAKGPLVATLLDRRIAALMAEGVINSYCYSTGTPEKGMVRKIMKRLPPVRLSTSANSEAYFERKYAGDEGETYKSIVGFATQFLSRKEMESRKIFLSKLKGVTPMNSEKCFSLHPEFLFPVLPQVKGQVKYFYPKEGRKEVLKTKPVKTGDVEVEAIDTAIEAHTRDDFLSRT